MQSFLVVIVTTMFAIQSHHLMQPGGLLRAAAREAPCDVSDPCVQSGRSQVESWEAAELVVQHKLQLWATQNLHVIWRMLARSSILIQILYYKDPSGYRYYSCFCCKIHNVFAVSAFAHFGPMGALATMPLGRVTVIFVPSCICARLSVN